MSGTLAARSSGVVARLPARFSAARVPWARACALVAVRAASTLQPEHVVHPINRHRSNAQQLIEKVPPIEVDSDVALCDGGGGATGHPIEYLQLNKRGGASAVVCKYCGLRYIRKPHSH